uniref:Uncharacterized protein n=1 Tax=Panagrolaimus sp. JU765 TaxID=591449 RepID=A0AC34RSC4_9BILA
MLKLIVLIVVILFVDTANCMSLRKYYHLPSRPTESPDYSSETTTLASAPVLLLDPWFETVRVLRPQPARSITEIFADPNGELSEAIQN